MGLLAVLTVVLLPRASADITWDGGGTNASINTPENWDPDGNPAFDGSATVVFASGGSTATINTSVHFAGITFSREADFTIADGAGTLSLGTGGIVTSGSSGAYQIGESHLILTASSIWTLARALAVSSAIADGAFAFGITKDGTNSLTLSGNNSYDGATTVNAGILAISHASALGTSAAGTAVGANATLQVSSGLTIQEPLSLNGNGDPSTSNSGALRSTSGTNTWAAPVTLVASSRIRADAGSLELSGGISGNATLTTAPSAGATLKVSTTPVNLGALLWNAHGNGGTTILDTPGSTFSELRVQYNNAFQLGASGDLPDTTDLVLGATATGATARSGTFDLNGVSQTIDQLASGDAAGQVLADGTRKLINSAAGSAILTLGANNGTSLFDGVIEDGPGTIALTKVGTGAITLARSCNYTGTTTITAGTLQINAAFLADASDVILGAAAKLHLNFTGADLIDELTIAGAPMPAGTYGASGSGATFIDDVHFAGSGRLQVTRGAPPARTRYLPTGSYNVLFVAVDDLKPGFGIYGATDVSPHMPAAITPNLDSLAASGMTFTRAYCQQAVCNPSRVSLLTSLRPDASDVWTLEQNFRNTVSSNIITLPQHFKNNGYRSAAYGKIFHLGHGQPADQDAPNSWNDGADAGSAPHNFYEDGHWQAEQAAPAGTKASLFATDAGDTNYWVAPSRSVVDDDYVDGLTATRSIVRLQTYASNYLASGQRFFLAVGFKKPHLPFVAPKAYWELYDPAQINLTGYTGFKTMPTGTLAFAAPGSTEPVSYDDINGTNDTGTINVNDARRLIHGYLAAASFMDAQLGRVLAALDASGVASNTIVVLWGDHGWHLGDHNGFWAKHSNFEQAARSPLLLRAPGMAALGTAGSRCHAPVELVDVFPTLVDLCCLPAPSQPPGLTMQGTSLLPLLEDPAQPWKRAAFSQYNRNIQGTGIAHPGNGMGYTMRTSRYRYTEWWRTGWTNPGGSGLIENGDVKLYSTPEHVELYDMESDPGETVNLVTNTAYASLVSELSAGLAGGNGWSNPPVAAPAAYPVSWGQWQSDYAEPGHPLTDLADALDPDQDELPNLWEYVLGTHPFRPDASPLWSGVFSLSGASHFAFEYPLVSARTDVALRAMMSTNLTFWSTNGVASEVLGTQAGRNQWRSRIPLEIPLDDNSVSGFLRLQVER